MKTIEVPQLPSPIAINLGALKSSFKAKPGRVEALAPVTFVRPLVVVDADKVSRYAAVCGVPAGNGVPMLYPHMEAFPLAMMWFATPDFPWAAMGMVHLGNNATMHAPIHAGDVLRIEVSTGQLYAHDKGQALSMHARALRGGALVWESEWIFLRTGVRNPAGAPYSSSLVDATPLTQTGEYMAPSDIGRRYGKVSGDINPIHLSKFTAKLMGFRTAIAHGMWSKAYVLGQLMPAHADKATVQVEFKTPMFLPAKVTVWTATTPQGILFEVRDAKGVKPHVRGRLT